VIAVSRSGLPGIVQLAAEVIRAAAQIAITIMARETGLGPGTGKSLQRQTTSILADVRRLEQEIRRRQEQEGKWKRDLTTQAAAENNLDANLRKAARSLEELRKAISCESLLSTPASQPAPEHYAVAAGHIRRLHLATGKLVLVMQRRHGANPRAAQAIGALQRLHGQFHMTTSKLLQVREAALRLQSRQTANLTPGFPKPVVGGFGNRG